MRNLINIYVLLIVCVIVSCSRKAAPLVSSMYTEGVHHKWKVIDNKESKAYFQPVYIDLRDVYSASVNNGCKTWFFTPKFGYNKRMQMANISEQQTGCTDNISSSELKAKLESVYSFSLGSGTLQLFTKSGKKILDMQLAADDGRGSVQREWHILQMINANNEQLLQDKAFIDFTDLSKATASVGCNRFLFAAVADREFKISIGKAVSTRMLCNSAATNEDVLAKVLPLVSKYQVIGNRIKLFDKDNILLIEGVSTL